MANIKYDIIELNDRYRKLIGKDVIELIEENYDKIIDEENLRQNLIKERSRMTNYIQRQKSVVDDNIYNYNKFFKKEIEKIDFNLNIGVGDIINNEYNLYIDPIGYIEGDIEIIKINKKTIRIRYNVSDSLIKNSDGFYEMGSLRLYERNISKLNFNKMYLNSLSDSEFEIIMRDRTIDEILPK